MPDQQFIAELTDAIRDAIRDYLNPDTDTLFDHFLVDAHDGHTYSVKLDIERDDFDEPTHVGVGEFFAGNPAVTDPDSG